MTTSKGRPPVPPGFYVYARRDPRDGAVFYIGKLTTVTAEIERMVRSGVIADCGDGRCSAYYAENTGNHPGTSREPPSADFANSIEPTGNHPGTTWGTAGWFPPPKGGVGNHHQHGGPDPMPETGLTEAEIERRVAASLIAHVEALAAGTAIWCDSITIVSLAAAP